MSLNKKNATTEKVIHLMTTTICDRNCKYCCNKQYDLNDVTIVTDEELRRAEVICLTGGEPFRYSSPNDIAAYLKAQYKNIKMIYAYTNAFELYQYLMFKNGDIDNLDGLSVSIKNKADADAFQDYIVRNPDVCKCKSNLLYVFDGLLYKGSYLGNFVWKDREWQENFVPAPDSIFRRI